MRIGFEADTIINRRASGSAKVTRRLIEQLQLLDPDLDIYLFHHGGTDWSSGQVLRAKYQSIKIPRIPTPRFSEALSYTYFGLTAGKLFDVVHYPRARVYPFFWRIGNRCVVTIHDAGHLVLRNMRDDIGPLSPAPGPTMRLINWTLRTSAEKIDAVIVVSNESRTQVIRHYQIPKERVHVVYNAPDDIFRPLPEKKTIQEDLRRRYSIPEKFVLCMGRLQPHKNIRGMLRAWAQVGKEVRRHYPLVILGRKHWRFHDVFELLESLNLKDEVIILDKYIPVEDLVLFMNAAEVFVFPSLFEGFGLPLVEAMACGAATIASNATSIPEIAGDGAMLIDANDPDEMSEAIGLLLSDGDLRMDLSRRAIRRARDFSWQKSGHQLLRVYRQLLDNTQDRGPRG
ncbi:MAG: glycosyltransferase family 4 protein [Chloroflexi bacterium]|nr:glycosyltransferase family 4 protein [Chloroflexota bacterium]